MASRVHARLPSHRPRWLGAGLATAAGGAVGFGLGAVIYLLVTPVLEDSSGLVRELQGLLWNLVPLLTAVGALAGWWLHARRPRRHRTP